MIQTLHAVCPTCGGVNRVAAERLDQGPVCGKCQALLLPKKPLQLDAAAFHRQVQKSGLPLLVDFWAPWCGPCRQMGPAFEQAAPLLHPRVLLAKVNTQEEQALAQELGIQSIPTLVLFRPGRSAVRVSGAMDTASIVQWARTNL